VQLIECMPVSDNCIGSFRETVPRKIAVNTVKHRVGGVGSVVANHLHGGGYSVDVTTLDSTTWLTDCDVQIQASSCDLQILTKYSVILQCCTGPHYFHHIHRCIDHLITVTGHTYISEALASNLSILWGKFCALDPKQQGISNTATINRIK